MADEREGSGVSGGSPADKNRIQTAGREENAARPLNAEPDDGGPERYPSVRQDEAVERTGRAGQVSGEDRSFEPPSGAPVPRQGAGDGGAPASSNDGRLGPGADPAEGKR